MVRTRDRKRSTQPANDTTESDKVTPKSIIIYRGIVGSKTRELMHEWRRAMLPWSSKRLRATSNTLKDFQHIANTFGVSHLQLLTSPSTGTSLRVLRFPSGPTLSFRVETFALRDDFIVSQRRPAPVDGPAFNSPPVVVLNNFNIPGQGAEVELMEKAFQGMFPSLNIGSIQPDDIQRAILFQYDVHNRMVEVRHYHISARATGVSRTVKKLSEGQIPSKLRTLESIDTLLEREGAWSDTDGEGEEIVITKHFRRFNDTCRVKLVEIGPRMTLRLLKVEAGFAGGEVLYHSLQRKTPREIALNAAKIHSRNSEKKKRRAEQETNVANKQKPKKHAK